MIPRCTKGGGDTEKARGRMMATGNDRPSPVLVTLIMMLLVDPGGVSATRLGPVALAPVQGETALSSAPPRLMDGPVSEEQVAQLSGAELRLYLRINVEAFSESELLGMTENALRQLVHLRIGGRPPREIRQYAITHGVLSGASSSVATGVFNGVKKMCTKPPLVESGWTEIGTLGNMVDGMDLSPYIRCGEGKRLVVDTGSTLCRCIVNEGRCEPLADACKSVFGKFHEENWLFLTMRGDPPSLRGAGLYSCGTMQWLTGLCSWVSLSFYFGMLIEEPYSTKLVGVGIQCFVWWILYANLVGFCSLDNVPYVSIKGAEMKTVVGRHVCYERRVRFNYMLLYCFGLFFTWRNYVAWTHRNKLARLHKVEQHDENDEAVNEQLAHLGTKNDLNDDDSDQDGDRELSKVFTNHYLWMFGMGGLAAYNGFLAWRACKDDSLLELPYVRAIVDARPSDFSVSNMNTQ